MFIYFKACFTTEMQRNRLADGTCAYVAGPLERERRDVGRINTQFFKRVCAPATQPSCRHRS